MVTDKKPSLIPKSDGNGSVVVHWKVVMIALAILLGGGGSVGIVSFASEKYVDERVMESEQKQEAREAKLDVAIGQNKAELEKHGRVIGEVQIDIKSIQSVQHQQYASDEARRVTENIKDRQKREKEYDRLYRRNLYRLSDGKEPCANVDCSY